MKYKRTFEVYAEGINPEFARLPTSICTETLVWDISTPEECSACVRESKILLKHIKTWSTVAQMIHSLQ